MGLVVGAAVLVGAVGMGSSAAYADSGQVLINADTVSGGSNSVEAVYARAQGFTVSVVSGAQWDSMTAAQFGQYQLLVAGDQDCGATASSFTSNESTWAPVVMGTGGGRTLAGNRVAIGTDPVFHRGYNSGANTLIQTGLAFAGSQPGRTGLYFDASCDGYFQTGVPARVLQQVSSGTGTWSENDTPPCGGAVAKIASTTKFDPLRSSDLAGWGCSVHETFPTFASDWHALAVATDTSSHPVCGTDTATGATACGEPYVLIAGSDIVVTSPDLKLSPTAGSDSAGGSHTITATLARSGSPLVGQRVSFNVAGVNTGATGTCATNSDCTTDANGQVSFTYTDSNGLGSDTITASFKDAATGSTQSATAAEQWNAVPQTITVTAADQHIVFGQADPAFGYTAVSTGSDTLTHPATCTVTGPHSDAGTYPITCTDAAAASNDTIAYRAGTLTVAKAPVTITADSASIVYGDASPTIAFTAKGLVGQDTLLTAPSCTVTGAHTAVGTYVTTCSGADAGGNYDVAYVDGTLTVAKATGVVTPDPQTVVYGSPDPTFSYTVSGLVPGDALLTAPTCGVVGEHSNVGTYSIGCSGADAGSNYTLSQGATAPLTVTAKALSVQADNQSITYGQSDPTFTYTTSGLVGTDTFVTAPVCGVTGDHSRAGTYSITCTTGDAGGNYALSYAAGTLTVAKAPLSVTVDSASRLFDQANPSLGGTMTGVVNGDQIGVTYSTVATQSSDVGTYPIIATLSGAGLGNYDVTITPGTLTVNVMPTVLKISSPAFQAQGGAVSVSAVLAEAVGGSPIGDQPVTLTVGKISQSATGNPASAAFALSNGSYAVTAAFGGSHNYAASTASQTLIAYQPTQFVIWGGNSAGLSGQASYNFWGSQWSRQIAGPSSSDAASFKGYASRVSPDSWTATGGNSSTPPASISEYIAVLVTTNLSKSGSTITGNAPKIAVLRVSNPGTYAPDPGHAGYGSLEGTL